MPVDFDLARFNLVEQQVRPWDVLDPRVLDAIGTVRREDFVAPKYRKVAYADLVLPLEHGESMMKPVVEGRTLQALDLVDADEVLEIGTGSGYLTACLATLVRAVHSIELHADLAERARARLASAGFGNVRVEQADAFAFAPGRQFDAVCVTGAVDRVPEAFLEWVRPGGRLFVIEGRAPVMQALRLTRRADGSWQRDSLFETDLPYLHGAEPVPHFAF